MKNIILIRHAKSSWTNMTLSDHDRPLNGRGEKNAPEMGKRLKKNNINPDQIISSSAKRAWSTAKKIAKEIGYPKDSLVKTKELFHANTLGIINFIRNLEDTNTTVMIFGHNPGFTACVNALSNSGIANIPTCGVASIELDIEKWSQTAEGTGKLRFYDFPKNSNYSM